jgi:hypothetical protein
VVTVLWQIIPKLGGNRAVANNQFKFVSVRMLTQCIWHACLQGGLTTLRHFYDSTPDIKPPRSEHAYHMSEHAYHMSVPPGSLQLAKTLFEKLAHFHASLLV